MTKAILSMAMPDLLHCITIGTKPACYQHQNRDKDKGIEKRLRVNPHWYRFACVSETGSLAAQDGLTLNY